MDQRAEQAEAWGIDQRALQAWAEAQRTEGEEMPAEDEWAARGEPFPVWPENWAAWEVWMTVQGSWHQTPMGRLRGLNWADVQAVVALLALPDPAALVRALREMQAEAVAALRQAGGET